MGSRTEGRAFYATCVVWGSQIPHTTRCTTNLTSKVNFHRVIDFRALCGAPFVTYRAGFRANKTRGQGYLAHKRTPSPRTLRQACPQGPMTVLGGGASSYERSTPVAHCEASALSCIAWIPTPRRQGVCDPDTSLIPPPPPWDHHRPLDTGLL